VRERERELSDAAQRADEADPCGWSTRECAGNGGHVAGAPWWKGSRGEWYVVVQVIVILLIAAGPRTWHGWPPWAFPDGWPVTFAALALLVGGACLAAGGVVRLGKAVTPLPYPPENAVLRETGPYRVVRHPMYCGVVLSAFGWALVSRGWLTLAYVVAGFVFIVFKVRREEKWLVERFPDYAAYQRRVRKLIPFVY
jgi:protein-S-isoprenylcysteine O-methyltransferase Ste14